jgi:uncharacterized lipoprotein YmbA
MEDSMIRQEKLIYHGIHAPLAVLLLGAVLLGAGLAGCSTLPPAKLYALTPVSGNPAATPTIGARNAIFLVVPVKLPDYLDREQLVHRIGPNEVKLDDDHRWAERPSNGLMRILAIDLSGLLGTEVRVISGSRPLGPQIDIVLDLLRFEIDQDGQAVMVGHWSATEGDGGRTLASGPLDLRAAPAAPDTAGEVAALNTCVSNAATIIAQVLERLPH